MGWDSPDSNSANVERNPNAGLERDFDHRLVGQISVDFLSEQRKSRRWGIFFKLLTFAYVTIFLVMIAPADWEFGTFGAGKVAAIVDVRGVIASGGEASADNVIEALRRAFDNKATSGVIVRINSPGGSPVQAGYINDEILRLREKHPDTPVYAVIEDVCASGGYYVAVAADEIFASRASIVGSIGVRMDSFGFVGAIEKLGIERRLITAGGNKGLLDPFLPLEGKHRAHAQQLVDQVHAQFIDAVEEGRRGRLADNPHIFSGLFWTGEESLRLGLIDKYGSADYVAREVLGTKKTIDYTKKDYFFGSIFQSARAVLFNWIIGAMGGVFL